MKIITYLCKDGVDIDLSMKTKKEVIVHLVRLLKKAKKISDDNKVIKILMEREGLGSTGIGQNIAMPHGKTDEVKDVVIGFGSSRNGIEFDALDGEPVNIIFLLLAPTNSAGLHLKALAKISRLLKDKYFRQALKEAKSPEEVIKIIKEEDEY